MYMPQRYHLRAILVPTGAVVEAAIKGGDLKIDFFQSTGPGCFGV